MDDLTSTLSDRLLDALSKTGVTQAELAKRIGVKPQAINYLCKTKTKKSQMTFEIADALGISSMWLANGEGTMMPEDTIENKLKAEQKSVPVFSYQDFKNYFLQHKKMPEHGSATEFILTNSDVGTRGFAFRLQDKSMYPRFEEGTILIFNAERNPKNHEFVLASIVSISDIIFRQLEFIENKSCLNPINNIMYKKIFLEPHDSIIGVLIEARWQS